LAVIGGCLYLRTLVICGIARFLCNSRILCSLAQALLYANTKNLFQGEDASQAKSSATAAAAKNDETKMQTTEDATVTSAPDSLDGSSSQGQTTDEATADAAQNTRDSSSNVDGAGRCLRVLRSSLWTNFPFIAYCMVVAAVQGCIQSILIFLPARGRQLGAGSRAAALLLTLFGVFDMAGRFVFGFVFDIRAVRRHRTYLYTAVAASFGAATALLAAVDEYVVLATGTCVVAVVEGGAHSQRATCVSELVEPSQSSLAVGLVIFAQGFGNFYGPLIGG